MRSRQANLPSIFLEARKLASLQVNMPLLLLAKPIYLKTAAQLQADS